MITFGIVVSTSPELGRIIQKRKRKKILSYTIVCILGTADVTRISHYEVPRDLSQDVTIFYVSRYKVEQVLPRAKR